MLWPSRGRGRPPGWPLRGCGRGPRPLRTDSWSRDPARDLTPHGSGPGLAGCPPSGEAAQVWARQPPIAGRAESRMLTGRPSASACVASESVGRCSARAAAVLACMAEDRRSRGHWPGPPRTDSRPRAPTLKFDGPVCRPGPNGSSAGGFVPRHSAFGRLRTGPPPGGRLGPSPAGAHGRLRVARAGSTARGSGPRTELLVLPAAAVGSPRLTGRQFPGVNPRKAHRPSVPRVSSPWLTSH